MICRDSNRIPLISAAMLVLAAAAADAQVTVPVPTPNQGSGPVAVSSVGSDLWINAGIFVALAGGALFAVCRGSRRV
jgi:hypothetical protein